MTKSERALLDTLKSLGLVIPGTEAPKQAAASPAPAWVAEALAGAHKAPAVKAPEPDRAWTFVGHGKSNSGRDTVIYQTSMRNGGVFQATIPGDLVRALKSGKLTS